MPKLNNTHIADRLGKRIAELEAGEEVAAKDVRALLTDEQMARLDAEWKNQELLRKGQRATTEEQKRALGWKSKREVRLEAFRQALAEANGSMLTTLNELQQKSMVRQMRVYMDTYGAAIDDGAAKQQAKNMANNALTRANLPRLDGATTVIRSKRDKELFESEQRLKKILGLDGDGMDGDKEGT
jgi:hypothetical protein